MSPRAADDRCNEEGEVEVAPFDPQSIELFLLLARKARVPTHFYPATLATYRVQPPPQAVNTKLGEAQCSPVHLCFGAEIDMEALPFPADANRSRKSSSAPNICGT